MAHERSHKPNFEIVKDGSLTLETKARHRPDYTGIVAIDDMLLVINRKAPYLQLYNRSDSKLIATSHTLRSYPMSVSIINNAKVAVCLANGTVVIIPLTSIDDEKMFKTLNTGFRRCYSLVNLNLGKLVVSGSKDDKMIGWSVLSTKDARPVFIRNICKGEWTHLAIWSNTVYISCQALIPKTTGVYAYDIIKPRRKKFLYQHRELKNPWSIMADRNSVYVCDKNSSKIHQVTDSGQLVTIHLLSSSPNEIFYDDQQGALYTTTLLSNVITVYKMKSLHQPVSVIPARVVIMDPSSDVICKEGLNDRKENDGIITMMVIDQCGVGKTTLEKRLLGKNIIISEMHRADEIDASLPARKRKTQEKKKLHWTVLNRCRSKLIKDLDVKVVMVYIQEKELFHDVTIRDINEQKTTTEQISFLLDQIKKRDQDTYNKFKECLIEAKRTDLTKMLEEEEGKIAAEKK